MATGSVKHTGGAAEYQRRAREVAGRTLAEWHGATEGDMGRLTDLLMAALMEEANCELRQVLGHLAGQIDLGLMRLRNGDQALDEERLENLAATVARGAFIVDTFLDRQEAAKSLLRVECAPLDLGDVVRQTLSDFNLIDSPHTHIDIESCRVQGDAARLKEVLAHLVQRFRYAAHAHEELLVTLGRHDGQVWGFIGLSPSHIKAADLMHEVSMAFEVEDVHIDTAYVRAMFEVHGGSFFVARGANNGTGFGFWLPLLTEEADP